MIGKDDTASVAKEMKRLAVESGLRVLTIPEIIRGFKDGSISMTTQFDPNTMMLIRAHFDIFPAIERNGTTIEFRLADDTAADLVLAMPKTKKSCAYCGTAITDALYCESCGAPRAEIKIEKHR